MNLKRKPKQQSLRSTIRLVRPLFKDIAAEDCVAGIADIYAECVAGIIVALAADIVV